MAEVHLDRSRRPHRPCSILIIPCLGLLASSGLHSVEYSPPENPSEDVAPSLTTWDNSVPNQEDRSPGVFGNDPQRIVGLPILAIGLAGQMASFLNNGNEQVGLVDIVLTLEDDRRPFQAHASVDAGRGKGIAGTLGILVVLHEDQVPKLHESLTVAVGMATGDWRKTRLSSSGPVRPQNGGQGVRSDHVPATFFPSSVVMELGAWAGGALVAGGSPPVVAVAVPVDALLGHSDLVTPYLVRIVVI